MVSQRTNIWHESAEAPDFPNANHLPVIRLQVFAFKVRIPISGQPHHMDHARRTTGKAKAASHKEKGSACPLGDPLSDNEPTYEELKLRLAQAEDTLHRCERESVANRFTAAVLHEVNNPLEAITNIAYLLGFEQNLSAAGHDYLKTLDEQLAVLTHVTRTSLSFVRDQSAAKSIDLVTIAQASLRLHDARLKKSNISVQTRFAECAMSCVIASEILQVVSNLMLNAMDALPEAAAPILHMRVHRCQHGIHITVADNGAGIPEEIESKLFHANITGKRSGTGIGLWLSKRLVTKHSGRMSYRTWRTPGKAAQYSGCGFPMPMPHEASGGADHASSCGRRH